MKGPGVFVLHTLLAEIIVIVLFSLPWRVTQLYLPIPVLSVLDWITRLLCSPSTLVVVPPGRYLPVLGAAVLVECDEWCPVQ